MGLFAAVGCCGLYLGKLHRGQAALESKLERGQAALEFKLERGQAALESSMSDIKASVSDVKASVTKLDNRLRAVEVRWGHAQEGGQRGGKGLLRALGLQP